MAHTVWGVGQGMLSVWREQGWREVRRPGTNGRAEQAASGGWLGLSQQTAGSRCLLPATPSPCSHSADSHVPRELKLLAKRVLKHYNISLCVRPCVLHGAIRNKVKMLGLLNTKSVQIAWR